MPKVANLLKVGNFIDQLIFMIDNFLQNGQLHLSLYKLNLKPEPET